MLATEGFRNNAELLAIDARLRANAGDHAGAAAAAAKARLRLDTLDAEVKDVALAHILCVEAVLAQAALDVNPERKTRAVAAWRAVAAHATATGHPELQPLARAGLASIQTP